MADLGGFDSFSMTDKAEIHMGKVRLAAQSSFFSNRNVFPSQTGLISEAIVRLLNKHLLWTSQSILDGLMRQ